MEDMPEADEELAAAIRDGHMEENPDNKSEVRITTAGLARFMILQAAAEAFLQAQEEEPAEPDDENAPLPTEE